MSNNNCLLPQKPPKPSVPILPFISPKMCKLVPDISFCSELKTDDFASKHGTLDSYMSKREGKFKANANSKTEQFNNLKLSVTTTEEKTASKFNTGACHDKFSSRLDLPANSFHEQHMFEPNNKGTYESTVRSGRDYISKYFQNSRPEEVRNTALNCPCCIESHSNFDDQNNELNSPCQNFESFQTQETLNEDVAQTVMPFSETDAPKCTNGNIYHLSHYPASQKQIRDKSNILLANSKCNDDTAKQMQVLMNRNEEMLKYIKSQDRKLHVMQEQVSYLLNEHSKLKNDILQVQNANENSNNHNLINSSTSVRDAFFVDNDIQSQFKSFIKEQTEQIRKLQKQVAMLLDLEKREVNCGMKESVSMSADVNLDNTRTNHVGGLSLLDASSQTTDDNFNDTRRVIHKTYSVGTMTNLTVLKDHQVGKMNKTRSSKQIHDPKSKPIRKTPVDTKSPKNIIEENCGRRITSPKNNPVHPEEINAEKYNSDSKDDHTDSTVSNESGPCRRCSLENIENISEDFRQKVMGNIEKIISKPETKSPDPRKTRKPVSLTHDNNQHSPDLRKTPKPISPTHNNNQHCKIEQCSRHENRLIEKENRASVHNSVVSKRLSKMTNCSSDMSYEFQRMRAKYLNAEDILEVQTSFSVIREKFSHSSCEYLKLHGFLKK